ncbi:ATP-binding protein [Luminiphilus sp.]|nr:ATP-binding protein [Luminiphilus sp.]
MNEVVRLIEDAQALDSLRSSDFDAMSAYGEVIDNSIQAGAEKVNIRFVYSQDARRRQIETLAFGDNGDGMTEAVLQSCLKLGWSSRFNDRTGIGRFGVGMILGAIHEVQRIEVYSRAKDSQEWLFTYVDLNEIKTREMEGIPKPISKRPPEKYRDLVEGDYGTLVLWTDYDRQKLSAEKLIEEAHLWIGRTFRHFIWDGLDITINGDPVKAHDPLFLRTDKSRFPNDPEGEAFDLMELEYPIGDPEVRAQFGDTGKVTIRMSLLPEKFRPVQGSGGSDEAKIRQIQEMQEGVSILREKREVFFGQIPYWSLVKIHDSASNSWNFTEKDRWWGCEISFGAELDSSFEVKNIKRGANPEVELKRIIKEQITPTRNNALKEVSRVWEAAREKDRKEKQQSEEHLDRHQGHSGAEKAAAKGGKGEKSKFNAKKTPEEVAEELRLNGLSQMDEQQKHRYLAMYAAQEYTIIDNNWRGPNFWEVTHGGGKIAMEYNQSHVFIKRLRDLEEIIGSETDTDRLRSHASSITTIVDLLLVSLAKAQSSFEETDSVTISDFVEDLNSKWGLLLKSFSNAWDDQSEEPPHE